MQGLFNLTALGMTITTTAENLAHCDVKLYNHCHIMPGDTTAKERLDTAPAV